MMAAAAAGAGVVAAGAAGSGTCSNSFSCLSGPFKATQFFEGVAEHLKCTVKLSGKSSGGSRSQAGWFSGHDLVDTLHQYLTTQCKFRNDISRENAIKLAGVLLEYQVFKPVAKSAAAGKFEDSKSAHFRFQESADSLLSPGWPHIPATPRRSGRRGSCSSQQEVAARGATRGERDEVRREVALAKLLTLIEMPFLDSVLTYNQRGPQCGGGEQGDEGKWCLVDPGAGVSADEDPLVHHCLRLHDTLRIKVPVGIESRLPHAPPHTNKVLSAADKMELCQSILNHYQRAARPVVGDEMKAVYVEIHNMLARGDKRDVALQALQMAQLILTRRQSAQVADIVQLILYMTADQRLSLGGEGDLTSEQYLTRVLAPALFRGHMPSGDAARLTSVMCAHWAEISVIPAAVHVEVGVRMRIRDACPIIGNHFCERVGEAEFERQRAQCSEDALRQLADSVIENHTMSQRDKLDFMKRFERAHPDIHKKYYANSL